MKNQKGYTLVELLIAVSMLASIAFGCFLIYIAWHFIQKFW